VTAPRKAHHAGTYQTQAKRVVDAAYANPYTRCWRCGLTLAEAPPTRAGKPQRWTAGHTVPGLVGANADDGTLLAEHASCNYAAGARSRGKATRSAGRWFEHGTLANPRTEGLGDDPVTPFHVPAGVRDPQR
jgi:hypothetical protein